MKAMRDPVALAYSGRLVEAHEAAIEQAAGDDPFVVAQALEALAVLGGQYGVRSTPPVDERLRVSANSADETVVRRAFDAAAALGSAALEDAAGRRLEAGDASWDVLRYAAQCPTLELGRSLARGWEALPSRLRDEALLTSRVMPVSSEEENDAWARRALERVGDASENVRVAAFEALKVWRPKGGAAACSRALEDDASSVRVAAAQALAVLDVQLLVARALELEGLYSEANEGIPPSVKRKVEQTRQKGK